MLAKTANGAFSGGNLYLNRTLENAGSIFLYGSGTLLFKDYGGKTGVLSNLAGASFTIMGGADLLKSGSGSGVAINNAGSFNVGLNSGSGTNVPFNNTGTLYLAPGAFFAVDGGGSSSGATIVGSGAELGTFGTYTHTATSSISGAGELVPALAAPNCFTVR